MSLSKTFYLIEINWNQSKMRLPFRLAHQRQSSCVYQTQNADDTFKEWQNDEILKIKCPFYKRLRGIFKSYNLELDKMEIRNPSQFLLSRKRLIIRHQQLQIPVLKFSTNDVSFVIDYLRGPFIAWKNIIPFCETGQLTDTKNLFILDRFMPSCLIQMERTRGDKN